MQLENEGRTVDLLFDTFEEANAAAEADSDPVWKTLYVMSFCYQPWKIRGGKQAYRVVRVRRKA